MRVARLPPSRMLDDDGRAITALIARERHPSTGGGADILAVRLSNIYALVKPGRTGKRVVTPTEIAADAAVRHVKRPVGGSGRILRALCRRKACRRIDGSRRDGIGRPDREICRRDGAANARID